MCNECKNSACGNISLTLSDPYYEYYKLVYEDNPSIKVVTNVPKQFEKAYDLDGGFDLRASMPTLIPANGRVLVNTDLKVAIPAGYVGIIKSRSGLATKYGIEHGAGVIDHGYTGEILVLMQNHGEVAYTIDTGDKIAQMLIVPICTLPVVKVDSLEDSERGENGFNSSGTN